MSVFSDFPEREKSIELVSGEVREIMDTRLHGVVQRALGSIANTLGSDVIAEVEAELEDYAQKAA